MNRRMKVFAALWLLAILLVLPACGILGGGDPSPESEEGILTYAILNPMSSQMQGHIDYFNRTHEDIQIEVRDYSDENGVERLLTELALGQVPDIMELHRLGEGLEVLAAPNKLVHHDGGPKCFMTNLSHREGEYWMPYRQMAQKGYLEDLWPYIENDPELGRDALLEEPLKAAEVNGGLYMVFEDFTITTLIGPERLVGSKSGWTLEELQAAFAEMPEGSTVLRFNATRSEVFFRLLGPSLSQFIDWESGTCSFDNEEFRNIVAFVELFPVELGSEVPPWEVDDERYWRMIDGQQMLEAVTIDTLYQMPYIDKYFEERAAFVGYPTADGSSGSFFMPQDTKLAMSSTCSNKAAAWELMGRLVRVKYRNESAMRHAQDYYLISASVNRLEYDLVNEYSLKRDFWLDWCYYPGAPREKLILIDGADEDDLQRFNTLVQSTTQIYWPDEELSNIVWESIGPYYAGDRSLEDTIRLVENRVQLYVNEQR